MESDRKSCGDRHPRFANLSARSLFVKPWCPGIHCILILLLAVSRKLRVSLEKRIENCCVGCALTLVIFPIAAALSDRKMIFLTLLCDLQYSAVKFIPTSRAKDSPS